MLEHANTNLDLNGLEEAVNAARKALEIGDAPYGAAVYKDGVLITSEHNRAYSTGDPTAHAEMLAIRTAVARLGRDLQGCILYTTCEPCTMCLGAATLAGIDTIVAGATDPVYGAITHGHLTLNKPRVVFVDDSQCRALLELAAALRKVKTPFTPTDVRKREQAMTLRVFTGPYAEVYKLFGRQSVSIEESANALITLTGLLVAITAAGLSSIAMLNPASRVLIGLATFLALVACIVVITRILTFKWAGQIAAKLNSTQSVIDIIQQIRDRKTKWLYISVYILIVSLASYSAAIFLELVLGW